MLIGVKEHITQCGEFVLSDADQRGADAGNRAMRGDCSIASFLDHTGGLPEYAWDEHGVGASGKRKRVQRVRARRVADVGQWDQANVRCSGCCDRVFHAGNDEATPFSRARFLGGTSQIGCLLRPDTPPHTVCRVHWRCGPSRTVFPGLANRPALPAIPSVTIKCCAHVAARRWGTSTSNAARPISKHQNATQASTSLGIRRTAIRFAS